MITEDIGIFSTEFLQSKMPEIVQISEDTYNINCSTWQVYTYLLWPYTENNGFIWESWTLRLWWSDCCRVLWWYQEIYYVYWAHGCSGLADQNSWYKYDCSQDKKCKFITIHWHQEMPNCSWKTIFWPHKKYISENTLIAG